MARRYGFGTSAGTAGGAAGGAAEAAASAVATISFAGASLDISDAVADVTSPVPAAASGRTAPSTIDGAAAVSPTTGATPEASVF